MPTSRREYLISISMTMRHLISCCWVFDYYIWWSLCCRMVVSSLSLSFILSKMFSLSRVYVYSSDGHRFLRLECLPTAKLQLDIAMLDCWIIERERERLLNEREGEREVREERKRGVKNEVWSKIDPYMFFFTNTCMDRYIHDCKCYIHTWIDLGPGFILHTNLFWVAVYVRT